MRGSGFVGIRSFTNCFPFPFSVWLRAGSSRRRKRVLLLVCMDLDCRTAIFEDLVCFARCGNGLC